MGRVFIRCKQQMKVRRKRCRDGRRASESEIWRARLLALEMGEGAGARECQQPQGAGKGKEAAAGGAWPCPHLDFSLVETILDSDLQKTKVCCYKPGRLWRFRFSSHRKLTQSLNAREAFLMVVCSTLVGASVCFRVQTVFCALLHHLLSPHNLWGRRFTSYVCSK